MAPKLLFWLAAWLVFGCAVAMVGRGVWLARCRRFADHRRAMKVAGGLIGLFLLGYLAKVLFLGREDRSAWTATDLAVLRVHELLIAVMLVAGTWGRVLAGRFTSAPAERAPVRQRLHRRLGRLSGLAAMLAFLTASWVLARMWEHQRRPEQGSEQPGLPVDPMVAVAVQSTK